MDGYADTRDANLKLLNLLCDTLAVRLWRIRNSAPLLSSGQYYFGPTIWTWSPFTNSMATWKGNKWQAAHRFPRRSWQISKLCWNKSSNLRRECREMHCLFDVSANGQDSGMNMPIFMPSHLSKYIFHQAGQSKRLTSHQFRAASRRAPERRRGGMQMDW